MPRTLNLFISRAQSCGFWMSVSRSANRTTQWSWRPSKAICRTIASSHIHIDHIFFLGGVGGRRRWTVVGGDPEKRSGVGGVVRVRVPLARASLSLASVWRCLLSRRGLQPRLRE